MQVYSYILSMVPNFSNADDLMQKTCETIWEKFDTYCPGTDFLAWSIAIANFKMKEFWKSEKRHSGVIFDDDLLQQIERDARVCVENPNIYLGPLQECIKKLSKQDFTMIKMKYYQKLEVQEIAARFDKSIYTIYKHLSRIYNVLSSCIRRSILLEKRS
jgi:RNA polymerase sigma-70 factor, ECF subfamily